MKLSVGEGSSVANYLIPVSTAALTGGVVATAFGLGWVCPPQTVFFAGAVGLGWIYAIGAMTYAVSTLQIPLFIIATLINSNILVAFALSAVIIQRMERSKYV